MGFDLDEKMNWTSSESKSGGPEKKMKLSIDCEWLINIIKTAGNTIKWNRMTL